ncbi:MAG: Holliday junction branch migration protein RuvA [Pseudomonadota bacterium]
MIGSLRGVLIDKQAPVVTIDCQGVGYEVETPMSTFLELPPLNQEVFLHAHLAVREDAQTLYGFATTGEKALFRLLIKVSGIGAKIALGVLSAMPVREFERCIQHEDAASLVKVPGIGKRTAERLIIEMRDKIDAEPILVKTTRVAAAGDSRTEALDALIALGYKPREVSQLIDKLDTDGRSTEDIIRDALKQAAG